MATTSADFYQRKADEMRRLAADESNAALGEQQRRMAAMYQALADQATGRPATRITIPKGLLRSA